MHALQPKVNCKVNLPPLRKLDAMLVTMLDGFHDSEFSYVDRGLVVSDRGENVKRQSNASSSDSPMIHYE